MTAGTRNYERGQRISPRRLATTFDLNTKTAQHETGRRKFCSKQTIADAAQSQAMVASSVDSLRLIYSFHGQLRECLADVPYENREAHKSMTP